jgi:predicted ATPase/DNA-binding SARP family transcriptional activator/DNA-binding CsgD family transcriptional regulator
MGMVRRRRKPAESEHRYGDTPAREPLRIELLGGFRVSVGSLTIEDGEWRLRKAKSLVKLLALASGHRLHRERVMDLLWPDLNAKAASNNLRGALHVARRTLDPDASGYLEVRGEQLVLCPESPLWVDVDAFEEAARTARRLREPAAYEAAVELYAGELLPEDRYEAWAEGRREALRQLNLALHMELAALHEERGEHERGIEALRRVLSEEPAREEAHIGLVRLYVLAGRRQEAALQYERLREALSRELDAEPSAESEQLYEEIRAGRLPPAPSPSSGRSSDEPEDSARHNLPSSLTSFVGREREMVETRRLLSMTRLLTLTGAGGSGKTRLGLEVARSLVGAYPDGAWLVELAGLTEPDLVPQAVATTLEVREQPGRPLLDALLDALRDKEMLIVVDNCEHLIDASAHLAEVLLHSCPRLRVLATSREPLGIRGEVLWQVSPLSLPDVDRESTVESLMRYEAVRLFVDRARLKLPDFGLTQENAGAAARVCRKLDGIPLAIELATARIGALAIEQVAQRLEASLDLLSGGSRTVEPRQQTLKATLDWSHDLLSEAERALLRRLSVFAGGWTLEAAEEVCSGDGIERDSVLTLLGELVYKSLVVAGAATGGAVRYRMLEPIRQYAWEKLEESGEADEVRGQHAAFFLAVAEEAEPELDGPRQRLWVEQLEAEHDNLREALSWVLEREEAELGLRFGGALWRFWFVRGYLSEGLRWMEQALAGSDEPAPARAKVLEGIGWLAQQYDPERAKVAYEEMLDLSRELGEKGNVATALNSLATLAALRGDHAQARALLEENLVVLQELENEPNTATTLKRYHVFNLLGALAIYQEGDLARASELFGESLALAREAEDAFRIGIALTGVGYLALLQGDHERATARCGEALALAHELGSAGVEIIPEALVNLGLAALTQGDHERATAPLEEALTMSQQLGRKPTAINALEGMASLAGALGEASRAARMWGAAEVSRDVIGVVLAPGERALHTPYLTGARSRLGDEAWEEALEEGREMSLDQAAEYALSREGTDPPTIPVPHEPPAGEPTDELTPREREVAALVARGLTNRQVSAELGISERTAGNHVARILRKLGLGSRAQIASWATERRLLTPDPD